MLNVTKEKHRPVTKNRFFWSFNKHLYGILFWLLSQWACVLYRVLRCAYIVITWICSGVGCRCQVQGCVWVFVPSHFQILWYKLGWKDLNSVYRHLDRDEKLNIYMIRNKNSLFRNLSTLYFVASIISIFTNINLLS